MPAKQQFLFEDTCPVCFFHEKEKKKTINMFTQGNNSKLLTLTCVLYHNRYAEFLFCNLLRILYKEYCKFYWQLLYYSNIRFLHFFRNKMLNFQKKSTKRIGFSCSLLSLFSVKKKFLCEISRNPLFLKGKYFQKHHAMIFYLYFLSQKLLQKIRSYF